MVLAEETGQPGELLVRFKASQRELLLDELELFKSTSEDGIAVVSEREHPNPRYLAVKERERDDAQKLISAIVGTVDTEETFEVIAPAYLLCSCIRSAAGVVCEELSRRVDELRPGLDSSRAQVDVQRARDHTDAWLRTLLAVNGFEPVRRPPPEDKPADEMSSD